MRRLRARKFLALSAAIVFTASIILVTASPTLAPQTLNPVAPRPSGPLGRASAGFSTGVSGVSGVAPTSGSAASQPASGAAFEPVVQFIAPTMRFPLPDLDPGLASRGPRPTVAELAHYQYGDPYVILDPKAGPEDWRISKPDMTAVRGYAATISVLPGEVLPLHLSGTGISAQIDVFRMGRDDGRHVARLLGIPIAQRPEAAPNRIDGLVQEVWPVSTVLPIPADWQPGMYLAKLTATNGGQSYLPFIVRSPKPSPLTVVLPTMTWQAYNDYGGADLYGWVKGRHPRAYEVSYGRPFSHAYGAGLFFRLDFPLIVWLEDHGYDPGYVADVDLARDPFLLDGVRTLVLSGHSEYWTASMRNDVDRAELAGVNVAFFGANQAFWQVRLATDAAVSGSRLIICYKSAYLDPITPTHPALATSRFEEPPVNRPPSQIMGLKYGGIVAGIRPMILGPDVTTFAPETGLLAGEALPGLIGDEVDTPTAQFNGAVLGATPLDVQEHLGPVIATAALWTRPGGGRVFDAGTFDFAWGLDPRYAASLSGFPAEGFSELTAEILAWLGAQPTA